MPVCAGERVIATVLYIADMTDEKDITRPLTIADLHDIAVPGSAALSHDGRYLVHTTTRTVIAENCQKEYISVLTVDTGQVLKTWEGSSPQWSPVKNEIAYLGTHHAKNYIWIYDVDKDQGKPLVPVYESHYFMGHLSEKNFSWSPDGLMIAYLSAASLQSATAEDAGVRVIDRLLYKTKGGRGRPPVTDNALTHIWVAPVAGGDPQLVSDGGYNEHSISWSPDGTRIAFISNRSPDPDNNQLHDLWSIDLHSKKLARHTENIGTASQPAWSPDGTAIAFLATISKVSTNDSPAEDTHLYLVRTDGSTPRCLTKSLDRRIEQICWDPQSTRIYFTAGDEGTTAIYSVEVDTLIIEKIVGEAVHVLHYSLNITGDTICYISTDTTHLPEVFLYNRHSKSSTQQTNYNAALKHCRLQAAETFWFKSFDGLEIQGWIISPSVFDPVQQYPLITVIHGGPHNMFGYEFEDRMQLLSAAGYGVLFINPRGSHGYGQSFSNGCVLNWGGGDYKDIMAGVDAAIAANSWIDAGRLGVTGQSYGGYMTNWIITQTNRFRAAVVDGGISNLVSFAGTSLYHSLIESEFNGNAWENFPLLWQWSPLRNVQHVSTPTLLLHGETDNEVPLSQAEEMYIALKKRGVPCRFVQYIGEGHGWRPDLKPANKYDVLARTIAWFGEYV